MRICEVYVLATWHTPTPTHTPTHTHTHIHTRTHMTHPSSSSPLSCVDSHCFHCETNGSCYFSHLISVFCLLTQFHSSEYFHLVFSLPLLFLGVSLWLCYQLPALHSLSMFTSPFYRYPNNFSFNVLPNVWRYCCITIIFITPELTASAFLTSNVKMYISNIHFNSKKIGIIFFQVVAESATLSVFTSCIALADECLHFILESNLVIHSNWVLFLFYYGWFSLDKFNKFFGLFCWSAIVIYFHIHYNCQHEFSRLPVVTSVVIFPKLFNLYKHDYEGFDWIEDILMIYESRPLDFIYSTEF